MCGTEVGMSLGGGSVLLPRLKDQAGKEAMLLWSVMGASACASGCPFTRRKQVLLHCMLIEDELQLEILEGIRHMLMMPFMGPSSTLLCKYGDRALSSFRLGAIFSLL